MGYRAVVALAFVALLTLAWHRLRSRAWRGGVSTTFSLLMLPALLLAVADLEALYLFARGCATPSGGFWRTLGLAALALANSAMLASSLLAWRRKRLVDRVVAALPPLDAAVSARLIRALPALSGVSVQVCPSDTPVLFTTGGRRPVIVVSRWVLRHLDAQELVAALAHELGHIAHGDGRLLWLVHALCPGGLGMWREPMRHLSLGLEQRADAWAAARVGDRLALASALVKVSRFSLVTPAPAPAFAGHAPSVAHRVRALMDGEAIAPESAWMDGWPVVALALGGLFLAVQLVSRFCGLHAL